MTLPTIDTVPKAVTGAGQDHGYPNPPTFVTIDLVNIPADPGHQNAGINQAAYDTFIDAQIAATGDPTTPGGAAWVVADQVMYDPEYSPKLNIDYDTATRLYNYGRITFPGGRRWYVFYTPVYLNPTTTLFKADIDEFPSFDWGLGYSMIERGHIAVAASQEDTYGANYLTAPEPINAPPVRGVLDAGLLGSAPDAWTVMVISANDLRGSDVGTNPFLRLHLENGDIQTAATKATASTVDSSGAPQATIGQPPYPWQSGTAPTPPPGQPVNGFVPDDELTVLATATGPNPAKAEINTAAAWAEVVANYPSAIISPTVSGAPASPAGYWDRALDAAIHADPSLYGITDPDLAPIGHSLHGLGIRINVQNVTAAQMISFGFSRFNDYTYTYQGPFIWDEPTPSFIEVFVPRVESSPMSTIDAVPAGGGCYLFTMRGFAEYMTIMQGAPWVTSGITDIRLIPSWAVSGGGDHVFTSKAAADNLPDDPSWAEAGTIPVFRAEVVTGTANPAVLNDWRTAALSVTGTDPIWRKLLTAQFSSILVGNGENLVSFLPDQWETANIAFHAVTGAAHGDPSIRIIPAGYNDLGSQMGVDTPVGGRAGTVHSGFGQAASNPANQDINPYLTANSTYQNWNTMKFNKELAQILGLENIQMNLGMQGIQAALGAASGLALGALSGGPVGAVAGAGLGASSALTAGIQASNATTLLAIDNDSSFNIGAYGLSVSGQAAVDTFTTWWQSLFSNSGGGTPNALASPWRAILAQAFNVIIVMPTTERINKLVSEWSRYGYMIGQAFTPPRLDVMTKFSYWQTEGALITGSTPQEKRQTIADAFDRGVTLWNSLADIGTDVTAANTPVAGVTY